MQFFKNNYYEICGKNFQEGKLSEIRPLASLATCKFPFRYDLF
jgi:hypothetical protein